jgi:isopenicillin N synthase-like dioxygenase
MNIFKGMAVNNIEKATKAIPLIDFRPAFRNEPGGLEAVARSVRHASENVGFFYMAGHGVPPALIDAAFAASREFHALPPEETRRLKINENNIGYLALNQSMQRASTVHKATRPNYNESFFISHDRGPEHPDVLAGIPLRAPRMELTLLVASAMALALGYLMCRAITLSKAGTASDNLHGNIRWAKPAPKEGPSTDVINIAPAPL